MILLCSDGLHSVVEDSAIEQAIVEAGTPAETAPRLIQLALARGARDNITAVVARYDGA